MRYSYVFASAVSLALSTVAKTLSVPSIGVPSCPDRATITYGKGHSVPNHGPFPYTQVDLCYNATHIQLILTAHAETSFFYNASYHNNDPIYKYEVQETFIARATNDPSTYLEFEVAPNNVTFEAFIFNPSKIRAEGAAFDTFYIQTPVVDGLTSKTTLAKEDPMWVSEVAVPMALFNVDEGKAQGTEWRMNFFRTVTNKRMFPKQLLGAWSVPPEANFHMSPYFGRVRFI